jgi:1-deoxy-D-xylulose-5-phosphate synthase
MDRAGLVGDDGPTHHGAFDVSYFRPIPNVAVMAPRDEAMLVHMLHTAIAHDGPAALRYPRGAGEGAVVPDEPELIPIGLGEILAEGERVALLGYGYGVTVALEAAALLGAHDLKPTVADARFAKPLDGKLVERLAADHDLVVTIEENVLAGGFGSAVLEHLEDAFAERPGERGRVLRVGIPDRYVTHGKPSLLRAEVGLSGESVAERVLSALPSRSLA